MLCDAARRAPVLSARHGAVDGPCLDSAFSFAHYCATANDFAKCAAARGRLRTLIVDRLPKGKPTLVASGLVARLNKGVQTMKYKILGLFGIALVAGSTAANAQEVTLDYTGSVMSGTLYSGHPYGTPPVTSPISGDIFFTGSITVDRSGLGANDWAVVSYNISLDGGPPLAGPGFPIPSFSLTTVNGVPTGATVGWSYQSSGGGNLASTSFEFGGSSGDSYTNTYGSGFQLNCVPFCGVVEGSSTPGVWQAASAPEIDPASAASGLTLLFGGLAVMRGRRKLES
jgi:hypothetical protein